MAEIQIDPQVVIQNLINEISRLNVELAVARAALKTYEEDKNTEE